MRVLVYLTSLIFRKEGLVGIMFSSREIFGISVLVLGRHSVQWLGSLHCLLWIGLPGWRLLGSFFKMNIDMTRPFWLD
jgi:hypothetical protein